MEIQQKEKEIAIEFAEYLLRGEVTKHTKGYLMEKDDEGETYWPKEFQLLLGQLKHIPDEVFSEFIKYREEK